MKRFQDIEDAWPELEELTPETIAPLTPDQPESQPVHELRAIARTEVEKARQSNVILSLTWATAPLPNMPCSISMARRLPSAGGRD